MAAITFGMGLSGVLMNVIELIMTYINQKHSKKDKTQNNDDYTMTLYFYIITSFTLFVSSMMYFVERNNRYAQFYYRKQEEIDKAKPNMPIYQTIKEMIISCASAKECLFYLIFCYINTFMVFPGVTNYAPLSFMDSKGPWY